MTPYPIMRALSVNEAKRDASSCPVVVQTDNEEYLVKLRGAGQGTGALVAEMLANELARSLGLNVPKMVLIQLDEMTVCYDNHAELADLLLMSHGLNLGFQYLHHARGWLQSDIMAVDELFIALVFWLDGFIMNVDRTMKNPNILWSESKPWLIDYGAALRFQYQWHTVTEDKPRQAGFLHHQHLFFEQVKALAEVDALAAEHITREMLHEIIHAIPDDFFIPLLTEPTPTMLQRRRLAYVAFLWKRLKPPRPFVQEWLVSRQTIV